MPNVILLTIDALRRDTLGCYGGGNLTPTLDRLAEKGTKFFRACSTGPYTQAAFPGILTSSYYLDYGRQKMFSGKRVLISEALSQAGIATAAFHSNAYLADYFGWNRGWDVFYDSMDEEVTEERPYLRAEELNKKAAEWMASRRDKKKPFFLWLHYMDVHEPYAPEKRCLAAVDPTLDMSQVQMLALFRQVLLKRDVSDKGAVETLKKLYLAHVREVDEAVGHLWDLLNQTGSLRETALIVTSDHGDEFGEHGGLSHDGKMFAELIDVPLIIYGPGPSLSGPVFDRVVSTIDIPPTVAGLFGLRPDKAWQGRSLLPPNDYAAAGVFGEAMDKRGSRETGQEKPIYYYQEDDLKVVFQAAGESWQLYDLEKDAAEKVNLINVSTRAEGMKAKLEARIKRQLGSSIKETSRAGV